MNISSLQKARYEYSPKLPGMLRNGIADICVCEGAETQSVADQEKIKALFPNTYGKKEITFQKGANTSEAKKQVVGVILSGGQAPGGHNVICGLYDALKSTNKENVLLGFKNGPSGLIDDDFIVFEDDYELLSIDDVKKYIDENGHLPDVPSGQDVFVNGYDMVEMDGLLLKKIEELTLYTIELNAIVKRQQEIIESLQSK